MAEPPRGLDSETRQVEASVLAPGGSGDPPVLRQRVDLHPDGPVHVVLAVAAVVAADVLVVLVVLLLPLPVAHGRGRRHDGLRYGCEGLRRGADGLLLLLLRLGRVVRVLGRLGGGDVGSLGVQVEALGRGGELALRLEELRLQRRDVLAVEVVLARQVAARVLQLRALVDALLELLDVFLLAAPERPLREDQFLRMKWGEGTGMRLPGLPCSGRRAWTGKAPSSPGGCWATPRCRPAAARGAGRGSAARGRGPAGRSRGPGGWGRTVAWWVAACWWASCWRPGPGCPGWRASCSWRGPGGQGGCSRPP